MPKKIEKCVAKLVSEGKSEESAWAICNAAIDKVKKLIDDGMSECDAWSKVVFKPSISNDSIRLLENKIDTNTGFLHSKVAICRSGVQEYLGRELGLTGDDVNKMFNVLRHPDDVKNIDSLNTYKNLVVTDDHPVEGWVNVDNVKQLQKGQMSETSIDESQEEVHLNGVITITDAGLIDVTMRGKVEVSLGYARELIAEDGIYNGIPYQYRFINIIANHLSVVDRGRCGGTCKIINDKKYDIMLDVKTNEEGVLVKITINGEEFEVSEAVHKAIMAERKSTDEETEKKDKEVESKDEEIKEVEKANDKLTAKNDDLQLKLKTSNDAKISDTDLNKLVVERAGLLSFAQTVIGDSIPEDVVNDAMAIKKAVVEKHFNISVDGKSDAYVDARFEMVQEDQTSADASVKQLGEDLIKSKKVTTDNEEKVATARENYLKKKGL